MERHAPPPAKPEIDPELAEMESNSGGKSPARVVTERLLRTVLKRRDVKQNANGYGKPLEKGHRDTRDSAGRDRRVRRAMARDKETPDPRKASHARLGRAKPVKSRSQLAYEYKTAVRKELSRIKTIRLVADCPEIKFVAGVPGLGTVWQLSQAPTAWIHSIPGLGPARRKKLRAYLISKNVPVAWEA